MTYYFNSLELQVMKLIVCSTESKKVSEIATELAISDRSIYYTIKKINTFLVKQNYELIQSKRNEGILLYSKQREFLREYLLNINVDENYFISRDKRILIIICYVALSPEKVNATKLVKACNSSRSTLMQDIKCVKETLESLNIYLNYDKKTGYELVNTAENISSLLINYLPEIVDFLNLDHFPFLDFDRIQRINSDLEKIEKNLEIEFTENTLFVLSIMISIGDKIQLPEIDEELKNNVIQDNEYIYIDKYFRELTKEQKICLALQLKGSRIIKGYYERLDFPYMTDSIKKVAERFVNSFEKLSCIEFTKREELISMLSVHMATSFHRQQIGLIDKNPLEDEISEKYADVLYITESAVNMSGFLYKVTNAEMMWFVMYFCAYIPKENTLNDKKLDVIIVCPSGMASFVFLKKQLEEFNNFINIVDAVSIKKINEYLRGNYLIISTVLIPNCENLLIVDALLTDNDKNRLYRKIFDHRWNYPKMELRNIYFEKDNNKDKSSNGILDLLDKSKVIIIKGNINYRDAVVECAKPLIDNGYITTDYVQKIISYEDEFQSYNKISDVLALMHASPSDGSIKVSASLLKADEIRYKDGNCVKIAIMLSIVDQQSHLTAINDIIKCFSKSKYTDELIESKTPEELIINLNKILETEK